MNEDPLDAITLVPINYFLIEGDLHRKTASFPAKKHLLPSTTELTMETKFAEVYGAWSEEGLSFVCEVKNGESVELFIDTRDIKNAGFNHRFCHHFVFLAEAEEGVQAYEATKFRTEDTHPLCDPAELGIEVEKMRGGGRMRIEIPAHCLVGFDPAAFDRIGFTYRINQQNETPQHFSVLTAEYDIEQSPAHWSRMRLR